VGDLVHRGCAGDGLVSQIQRLRAVLTRLSVLVKSRRRHLLFLLVKDISWVLLKDYESPFSDGSRPGLGSVELRMGEIPGALNRLGGPSLRQVTLGGRPHYLVIR